MRTGGLRSVVFAAMFLAAASAAAAPNDGVRTAQLVEAGSDIRWGHATGIVDEPLQSVLPVVTDYGKYVDFMPYFTKSQVLAKRGTKAMAYMEVKVAAGTITLWAQLQLVETELDGDARLVEAKFVDGNIRTFRASWRLTPLDDGKRTRVEFKMHVDPDLPLPSSLFSRQNEKAAGKTIEALREHVTAASTRPERQKS